MVVLMVISLSHRYSGFDTIPKKGTLLANKTTLRKMKGELKAVRIVVL